MVWYYLIILYIFNFSSIVLILSYFKLALYGYQITGVKHFFIFIYLNQRYDRTKHNELFSMKDLDKMFSNVIIEVTVMNQNYPFYERSYICPICQMNFSSLAIRRSAVSVEKRESDYHPIYKEANPLHYSIIVCPVCKYAANKQTFSSELPAQLVVQLGQALLKLDTRNSEFTKERDLDTVLESFQLAIRTAQLKKSGAGELAALIHAAAWICREANNAELERAYLDQALKNYLQAYENSSDNIGKLSEVQIVYLIGELNLRAGEYSAAIRWFNRAFTHVDIKQNPSLEKLVREQWQKANELNQKPTVQEMKTKPPVALFPQQKAEPDPSLTGSQSKRPRTSIQMMSNLYTDQIEWLNQIMNSGYDYSKTLVSRDEIVKSLIDACREYLGEKIPEQFASETELKARWLELLKKD